MSLTRGWEALRRRGYSITRTAFFADEKLPNTDDFDFLIIVGGSMGVYDKAKYPWLKEEKKFIKKAFKEKKQILGICLGAQLLAEALGAKVSKGKDKEIGWFEIYRSPEAGKTFLHKVFPTVAKVFHWHGDTFDIPEGAEKLASSKLYENQGFVWQNRVVALQFHLEMTGETVLQALENGKDELASGGPGVQTEKEIVEKGEVLFEQNHRIMDKILEVMTRAEQSKKA